MASLKRGRNDCKEIVSKFKIDNTKCLRFSPDGKTAFLLGDTVLQTLSIADGMVCAITSDCLRLYCVSRDGQRAVVQNVHGRMCIRSVSSFEIVLLQSGGTGCGAFSPDGKLVLIGGATFSSEDGSLQNTLAAHSTRVTCCAFSPDSNSALIGSYTNRGSELYICEARPRHAARGRVMLQSLAENTSRIHACAFSPDGQRCMSLDAKGDLTTWWDVGGEHARGRIFLQGVTCFAFSPDGKSVLTGGRIDMALRPVAGGDPIRTFTGFTYHVRSCAFSADGSNVMCVQGDETITVWMIKRYASPELLAMIARAFFDEAPRGLVADLADMDIFSVEALHTALLHDPVTFERGLISCDNVPARLARLRDVVFKDRFGVVLSALAEERSRADAAVEALSTQRSRAVAKLARQRSEATAALSEQRSRADAAEAEAARMRGDASALSALSIRQLRQLSESQGAAIAATKTVLERRVASLEDDLETARMCQICIERPKDCALGCGHFMCSSCAGRVSICPECRARVTARNRVFA